MMPSKAPPRSSRRPPVAPSAPIARSARGLLRAIPFWRAVANLAVSGTEDPLAPVAADCLAKPVSHSVSTVPEGPQERERKGAFVAVGARFSTAVPS
eukprot:3605172-Prymnesium_polylepis.1